MTGFEFPLLLAIGSVLFIPLAALIFGTLTFLTSHPTIGFGLLAVLLALKIVEGVLLHFGWVK